MKKPLLLVVFSITALLISWPSFSGKDGADPGLTGAPGEEACDKCHNSTPIDNGPGTAVLDVNNLATTYNPGGGKVVVNLSVMQQYMKGFGFEVTALDQQGNKVGSFTIPSGVGAKIITGNGKEYAVHNKPGGTVGSVDWNIEWTPPKTDVGTISVYACFVSGDLDNTAAGDDVYTDVRDLEPDATGVTDLLGKKYALRIGPNPASEGVWVSFLNPSSAQVAIRLKDMQGKDLGFLYRSALHESIQFEQYLMLPSNLAKGMYVLEVNAGSNVFTKRLIVR